MSAVFLFTFLLIVIGMINAWESHANLKGLSITCLSIDDVQKGETLRAIFFLEASNEIRYGINYQIEGQEKITIEKLPLEGLQFIVSLPAKKRGCFKLPTLRFSSNFPFGLFQVWGYAFFDKEYYVYPNAISPGFWPQTWVDEGKQKEYKPGTEDLDNLKPVNNPWIQANRIAWKIAARGQGWYLKTMNNPEGSFWLFKLEDLPAMDVEQGLQHLSYWLQAAEQRGLIYGLELKGIRSPLAAGTEHLRRCLQQLAVYQ